MRHIVVMTFLQDTFIYLNSVLSIMIRNKNAIKMIVEINNDVDALKTIQEIRKLNGFRSISFKYKGE